MTDNTADEAAVPTVSWPILDRTALYGPAGQIIEMIAPHTEADPAALLVQLLAIFGATVGHSPHIVISNTAHHAVLHPLIVGRTNVGAKGTGLAVVEAIRRHALPEFDGHTTSGLSSAEGLIELVCDPAGDDPGVEDKRLLIKETEYKSVLTRSRREGNTLGTVLRQCWDGDILRTLTKSANSLTATDAHIVVIGHITPREFRATLRPDDLSGGSINRLLICLSHRTHLNTKMGNLPDDILDEAAKIFGDAVEHAGTRGRIVFTDEFHDRWNAVYPDLARDRPDSDATDATARAVPQVLRLALIYALYAKADAITVAHLEAALALWSYAEQSARWLFSTHQLEQQHADGVSLAQFILDGGKEGRTRTAINRDYYKSNKTAAEITKLLEPLVHDGTVVEVPTITSGTKKIHRYVHRTHHVSDVFTDLARQGTFGATYEGRTHTYYPTATAEAITYKYVSSTSSETSTDLRGTSNTSIRNTEVMPAARGKVIAESGEHLPHKHCDSGKCGTCIAKRLNEKMANT